MRVQSRLKKILTGGAAFTGESLVDDSADAGVVGRFVGVSACGPTADASAPWDALQTLRGDGRHDEDEEEEYFEYDSDEEDDDFDEDYDDDDDLYDDDDDAEEEDFDD